MFKRKIFMTVTTCLMMFLSMLVVDKISAEKADIKSFTPTEVVHNDSLQELHQELVNLGLAKLNQAGQIVIDASVSELNFSSEILNEYLEDMKNVNFAVEQGGVFFDQNLDIQIGTQEEVTNRVYNKDLVKRAKNSIGNITPFADPGGLPTLQAYHVANRNRTLFSQYFNSVLEASKYAGNPSSTAISASTGWFVAKVKPRGDWDYKVVAGYSPYSKQWNAQTKNSTTVRTTEWFGNYNYGLAGSYLFGINELIAGGHIASLATSLRLDGADDRAAVTLGFNDSK